MIYYFSATNNSKHVACKIASALHLQAKSILDIDLIMADNFLGVVFPAYCLGLPDFVLGKLKSMTYIVPKNTYVFFVSTYGTTPGVSSYFLKEILFEKGIVLDVVFSIKMLDTYTPIFDLTNLEKIKRIQNKADIELQDCICDIKKHKNKRFMKRQMPSVFKVVHKPWYHCVRKTKIFCGRYLYWV